MEYKTPGARRERRNTLTSTGGLIVKKTKKTVVCIIFKVWIETFPLDAPCCEAVHVRSQPRLHHQHHHEGNEIAKRSDASCLLICDNDNCNSAV